MSKILVKISHGKATVSVEGVQGMGCKDLTRTLEGRLGKVVDDQETPDAYETNENQIRNQAG